MQYRVKALSLSSRGSKIFKSGDIVHATDFKASQIPQLLRDGFLERISPDGDVIEIMDDTSDILIIIFSYNRKKMLHQILRHLDGFNIVVIDDGSPFPINHNSVISFTNGGKKEFWQRWDRALSVAQSSHCSRFIFMPDDFLEMDMDRIQDLMNRYGDAPYVYNLINDDREWSWIKYTPNLVSEDTYQIGFTDGGFFCSRSALDKIGFHMIPIRHRRKIISSGIGHQLTHRFTRAKVPFYKPLKSLAFHGDHPSQMHPEERIKNPIISK